MNRKQRRAINKRRKGADLNDPVQAQAVLESLSIADLVAGINNSLGVLNKRGVAVKDWDQKSRELYRLKAFGDRVVFLAADPKDIK